VVRVERRGAASSPGDRRHGGGERCSRATEREGREEDDGDLFAIIQTFKGFTVKYDFLSNHIPNKNMPKSKSVEFKKNYNFALRVSFKRVRVLKLSQNLTNYQISHKTYLKFTFQLKP
jgi:hypothetical protein